MRVKIGLAQFPLGGIAHNLRYVRRHVASAARRDAKLVLFSETALSGYVGDQIADFDDYDWDELAEATEAVCEAAVEHQIWVVLGTTTPAKSGSKPFNSLVVIDPRGRQVHRYDKRLCARDELEHYRPGTEPGIVRIAGLRCGLLICHEWRYPVLYRQYRQAKVDLILQAWYDAGHSPARWAEVGEVDGGVTPAAVQGHAACNYLWIAGTNASLPRSGFGGFVVRPDGSFAARQRPHRSGVLVCEIDTEHGLPDRSGHGRARAARLVRPKRSRTRHR